MCRRLPILVAFCLMLGAPWMFAQEKKFEFNGLIGYTLSTVVRNYGDVFFKRPVPVLSYGFFRAEPEDPGE